MRGVDRLRRTAARACLVAALAACASAPAAHAGRRTADAMSTALRDPGTWVPAVAALIIALTGRDHEICDRAIAETPVFRSNEGAGKASNTLREVAYFGMLATSPLVPGAESSADTWGEVMVAEHVGLATASAVTWTLKRTIGRERPNGKNRHSFPSGHATRAFAARGAIAYNLHRSTLADPARIAADVTLSLAATGVAWARVEDGAHHTTDVLAGAALGNFFGRLFAEAMGPDDDPSQAPSRGPGFPGLVVSVRF